MVRDVESITARMDKYNRRRLYASAFSAKDSERPSYGRTTCFLNLFERQRHGNSSSKKMFEKKHVTKCLQRSKTCWLNNRSLLRGPTTGDEKQELSLPPTKSRFAILPPSSHSLQSTTQPPGAKGWNPTAPGAPCCFNMKLLQKHPRRRKPETATIS